MRVVISFFTFFFLVPSVYAFEYKGEARKFIEKDVFTCPSTGLTFRAPDLNTGVMAVSYKEKSPGRSWKLVFIEEMGHMGVVVYSKIRPDYPNNDLILGRTASNIKQIALKKGGYVEWCGFLSEEKGRVFQCIIRYPGAGQTVSMRNIWIDSMESMQLDVYEIRQYMVRKGYFVEFKLFVPQFLPKGSFDEDKLLRDWELSLNAFVRNSGVLNPKDNYGSQVKAFKKPKTYFRYIFKNPSHG